MTGEGACPLLLTDQSCLIHSAPKPPIFNRHVFKHRRALNDLSLTALVAGITSLIIS